MNVDALSLRELRIEIAERMGLDTRHAPPVWAEGPASDGFDGWGGWLCPRCMAPVSSIGDELCCPNWPENDAAALELFTTAAAGDWYVYLDNDAGYERRGARTGSPSFWNCCIGGACHLGAKTLAEAISRAWLKWKVSE